MADYGYLQDHAEAMLDLLYAEPDLTVYPAPDGGPTTVPAGAQPPYVSVHFVADRPLGGRLDHRSTRMRIRAYAYCVGANDVAARAVSDLVMSAWLGAKPFIVGRSVYPIRSEPGGSPASNETTGETTVTITDLYRLESDPGRDSS